MKDALVPVNISRLEPSRLDGIENWPRLDQEVLIASRSGQVCMTCHFFATTRGAMAFRCSAATGTKA